ncbi:MAG: hypothetical protein AAF657_04835, partial [Acidobacteriota bacterium]
METALGHAHHLRVEYQPGEFYPFLKDLELPFGGTVRLTYEEQALKTRIDCLKAVGGACDPFNPNVNYMIVDFRQTRVTAIEHSGGAYSLAYDQHPDLPDDPATGTHRFTVTVLGPEGYERETDFYGPPLQIADPGLGTDYLIGQPMSRVETYRGQQKHESWSYEGYVVASYPAGSTTSADRIVVHGIPSSYRLEADGGTTTVDLSYLGGTRHPQKPSGSLRYGGDDTGRSVSREFRYLDRFTGDLTYSTETFEHPYQLALVTESKEEVHDTGGSYPLGRIAYLYDETWPRPVCKVLYARNSAPAVVQGEDCPELSPADGLVVDYSYHDAPGGLDDGMLESQSVGGAEFATRFADYQYGVPEVVTPPLGEPMTRIVRPDGQLDEETTSNVRTEFQYDADGRLRLTVPLLGFRSETRYSPPLAQGAPAPVGCRGEVWQESIAGNRSQVSCVDAWGRASGTVGAVDTGVSGVTSTFYSDLGLGNRGISALGAETKTTFDVLGRPVKVVTRDPATGEDLGCVDTYFDSSGFETETTTVSRVRCDVSEPAVVRVQRTDLAGRTLEASTNGHRTEFLYTAAGDGHHRVETRPIPLDSNGVATPLPSRFATRDLLDRMISEQHPETGLTSYVFDERGLLESQSNSAGDHFKFVYDELGRLRERRAEVGDPPTWQPVEKFEYDDATGLLTTAEAIDGSRSVVSRIEAWDAMNRPTLAATSIPDPLDVPRNLRPAGQIPRAPRFYLGWTPDPALAEFLVELRLEGRAAALRFLTSTPSLLLDEAGIRQAISALSASEQQVYLAALGDLDPFLLDPAEVFEWRVRGLSVDLEPTFWSAWVSLRDGCQIVDFDPQDGINGAPLIQWTTQGCPNDGPLEVRVLTSTGDLEDDACELRDGVFSRSTQGPAPAHFMVHGYNYSDVHQAHTGSLPNYQITVNGAKDCEPLSQASFRLVIVDQGTGQVLEERPAQTVRSTFDPSLCHIENFYVNHGYDGRPPTITWVTRNCGGHYPVVRASTVAGLVPPECELFSEPQWTSPAGSEEPLFMAGGWTHPGTGGVCAAVTAAAFWLEVYDNPALSGEPMLSRLSQIAYVDPPDDGSCHFRYFDVEMPTTSPPFHGRPVIHFESRHCDTANVQVLASTARDAYQPGCRLRNWLVSTAKNGPLAADFMTSGYEVEGAVCDATIQAADIWVVAQNSQGAVLAGRPPIRARYEGALLPPANAGCEKKPLFDGLQSVTLQGCSAELAWNPAVSLCQTEIRYRVYRAPHSGVLEPDPSFLIADNLVGTSYTDATLLSGGHYFYRVEAYDPVNGNVSGNQVVRPASPVCGGSANFFEATGGQNPFQPLPAGTAVDLLWGFPGATYVFLPG